MLDILRRWPLVGFIYLNIGFQRDLNWFSAFLFRTNGIYMTNKDKQQPTDIFIDTCTTGCSAVCLQEAYHAEFLQHVLDKGHLLYHMEALITVVALRQWAHSLAGQ